MCHKAIYLLPFFLVINVFLIDLDRASVWNVHIHNTLLHVIVSSPNLANQLHGKICLH